MLILRPDIKITRRLYSHFLLDEHRTMLLQTPRLAECFDHLHTSDDTHFRVEFDDIAYVVQITERVPLIQHRADRPGDDELLDDAY